MAKQESKQRGRGRPPSKNPLGLVKNVRLTDVLLKRLADLREEEGYESLNSTIRRLLNESLDRRDEEKGKK